MALCPSEAVQLNDNEPLGCRDTLALPIATARIHPHMPRRRKSMSPHRASGCSTPPSAALRRVSYWVTTLDGTSELRVAFDIISEFFLRRPLSRSSSGVHPGRISPGPALPARALEWAGQRYVVFEEIPVLRL